MTPDIDDVFETWQCICAARNQDVPKSMSDLMPGTEATIRVAAEIKARRRNMRPAPRPARTVQPMAMLRTRLAGKRAAS